MFYCSKIVCGGGGSYAEGGGEGGTTSFEVVLTWKF